jgi:glycerophosphoryl diester phosphodiesterase
VLELQAARTGKVLIIGHRGALGNAPENTMASFEIGLEQGCDLVETDIHVSRDGALICMHDAEVSRTTDGKGRIKDMTVDEIKKLDAGSWFGERFRGQRVPVLSELLEWARTRIPLVIEIKGDPLPAPGIEAALLSELRRYDLVEQVMVIGFHHDSLRRIKDLEPRVATGLTYSCRLYDTVGAARATRADSIRPHWSYWSQELVQQCHKAALTTHAWVANDEKMTAYLCEMGIDSLGVDFPDRVRPYLDRTGRSWNKR